MSYTLPDQEIDKPVQNCLESLETLRKVAFERLKDDSWKESHKEDLRELLAQISILQIMLTKF